MKKNNWLVPFFIATGVALVAFSIFGPKVELPTGLDKKKVFAKVIEKTGNSKVVNADLSDQLNIEFNQKINAKDLVQTDSESEVVIEFYNSSQFRITEKSEVLIDELEEGKPLVVIRSGDIYIEKFGKSHSFWIRKEGQLYSAVDYAISDKNNSLHLKEEIPTNLNKGQLSQIEIESVLNRKKNDFFKCFGQLIQKNALAGGQVLISFTIEKNGLTSKIEISKSDIQDNTFKSCLVEVVARAKFRSFDGASVATVFPLRFD